MTNSHCLTPFSYSIFTAICMPIAFYAITVVIHKKEDCRAFTDF